jgi:dienelactone hydrolase
MEHPMAVIQRPIQPSFDLRDMLRQHIITRSLACMDAAAERRRRALAEGAFAAYRGAIRAAVAGFYGTLPVGEHGGPVRAKEVSRIERRGKDGRSGPGYRLENVLFDSFPGWEVNATVYVPLDFAPPYPAVIIPVGHSGKQFESYQLPAQYFAACGYLAVVFDPPGQASEKQPGNDHFVDGVRGYPLGQTSSRYFVADALRCIDYVAERPDVDISNGVAMTGISGGGTTTTLATLLDDRIRVAAPSCCLTPLADLDISQCYAGCPETHMWRRYTEGVDEVDLLAAAAPVPLLVMAGEHDEVFHIADTRRLAEEVAAFYRGAGMGERFEFFADRSGHAYTLEQARRFVRFADRWLAGQPERGLPDLPPNSFSLDPYEMIQCHPRQDVHMRSLAAGRAAELEAARDHDPAAILAAAREVSHATGLEPQMAADCGEPFPVWTHGWQQVLLRPEPGIELPATLLVPLAAGGAGPAHTAILHFDDRGRNRLLYRHGPIARAAGFLEHDGPWRAVLSVDLRGWGDSAPAVYPYEMAGWGGIDRYVAYATAALGDPVLAMRMRDGLAGLAFLRGQPGIDAARIVVSGCGLGGVVALHVAAMAASSDAQVYGVVAWDMPSSFRMLVEAEHYTWPADAFLPNVLLHYDLPELAAALRCRVALINPLDNAGAALSAEAVAALNAACGKTVYHAVSDPGLNGDVDAGQAIAAISDAA